MKIDDVVGLDGGFREQILLKPEQVKGKKGQRVFVCQKLRSELRNYLETLADKRPLLPLIPSQKSNQHFSSNSLVQLINRIFVLAGIDTSSHAMRRQFITNLANNGVNPRIIQKLVNHRSLNHTMGYIEVTDDQMMNAVEGI